LERSDRSRVVGLAASSKPRRGEISLEQPGLLGEGLPHFPDVVALECLRETPVGGDHPDGEFGRGHFQPPSQTRSESAEENHTPDRRKPVVLIVAKHRRGIGILPESIEKGMTLILSNATARSNQEESLCLFETCLETCFIHYATIAASDHAVSESDHREKTN